MSCHSRDMELEGNLGLCVQVLVADTEMAKKQVCSVSCVLRKVLERKGNYRGVGRESA